MRIIGHGVDVVEVARIERMLAMHGRRFAERCFTDAEQAYAESGRRRRAERYAVRFAAKEAVMKVLGTGWSKEVSWREIEVRRHPSGKPEIALHGRTGELAAGLGIEAWHVSLSHTSTTAVASVIGIDQGVQGACPDQSTG